MGGGAMRTAAKAAVMSGYRSVGQASAAARRTTRPPAASVAAGTTAEGYPPVSALSSEAGGPALLAVEKPSWDIDHWEFAGGKEEELFDAIHPAPRLVFGPAPTLEEAKEATSDLKEALQKAYFSSGTTDVQGSKPLEPVYLENSDAKACVTSENAAILPIIPKHVVRAFSLLQESPEAQDVVASLASDKNVWDAVMKNEKVMEFYRTQQSIPPLETVSNSDESVVENKDAEVSLKSSDIRSTEKSSESSGNGFVIYMRNVKTKVSEMVNNLSDFFQDILGSSAVDQSSTSTKSSTAGTYMGRGIGASFIALAIGAILVILLKRR